MRRNYSQPSGSASYQRRYAGFRGVDFTNNPLNVDFTRSPYAENIVVDSKGVAHKRKGYKPTECVIQTTEGLQRDTFSNVHGMYVFKPTKQKEMLIIHAGTELYSSDVVDGTTVFWHITGWDKGKWGYMNDAPSCGFQHKDRFYIMDGKNYYNYWFNDEDGQWCLEPVYMSATPTETQVAGYYLAEEVNEMVNGESQTTIEYTWQFGEKGERNILTQRRYNTFCGDGHNTKFYLDGQNLQVLKVEQYSPSSAAPSAGGEGTFTNGNAGSNVRDKPSMEGKIIGHASANQSFPVLGKQGSWYKIQYSSTVVGYIHQSRGTYTDSGGGSTPISATETDWVTLTRGTDYTVGEVGASGESAGNTGVKVYNCTKITFTNAPNPHPRGNGLPNIRVLCVPKESASITIAAEDLDSNRKYVLTAPRLAISDAVVIKKNGTALTLNTDYTVVSHSYHDHIYLSIVFGEGVVGDNDEIVIHYNRESMDGIDAVSSCDKYGKFGEYNFDRFFFTGNTSYLNRDWYTEAGDATCVLENSYNDVGDPATPIAGYLNMMSDMLVIKQETPFEALFRRTASSDGDMPIFPVKAYQGDGAVNRYALTNIKGKCLYLSRKGLFEFVSSDLGTKYGVQDRSWIVNEKMLREDDFDQAYITNYNDLVIIAFPSGNCYVADTNQQTAPSTGSSYGFEFFYWTRIWMQYSVEFDGVFYFASQEASGDALYEVPSDDFADYYFDEPTTAHPITALWTTPLDEMDEPARYKYLSRRGAMLQFDQAVSQMLEVAVVMDGEAMLLYRDEDMLRDYLNHSDYTLMDIKAATGIPYFTLNTPGGRCKYLQFILRNSDPNTDGIALMCLEFQYRFGRYII